VHGLRQCLGRSQAQLVRATHTAPTLTGRVIESLIEHGWIRWKRSSEDRRQYVLELTASGERVRDRVETARTGASQSLACVIDVEDVEHFDQMAVKILSAFRSSGSGAG
jgi:DNA-binding MarR family transcriptional regulator